MNRVDRSSNAATAAAAAAAVVVPKVRLKAHVHLQQLINPLPLDVPLLNTHKQTNNKHSFIVKRHCFGHECTNATRCQDFDLLLRKYSQHVNQTQRLNNTDPFHVHDSMAQQNVVPLQLPERGAARPRVGQLFFQKNFGLLQRCTQLLLLLQGAPCTDGQETRSRMKWHERHML